MDEVPSTAIVSCTSGEPGTASSLPAKDAGPDARAARVCLGHRLYQRIALRFYAILLLVVVMSAGGIIWTVIDRARQASHDEALRHLMIAVADTAGDIVEYVRHQMDHVDRASLDGSVRAALGGKSPLPAPELQALNQHLAAVRALSVADCEEVFLLNPQGMVIASSVPARMGDNCAQMDYFIEGRKGVWVGDVSYDTLSQSVSWVFSAPVMGADGERALGVIAERIAPSILSTIGTGQFEPGATRDLRARLTGETYVLKDNGLLLSDVRFKPDAALRSVVDIEPVRRVGQRPGEWVGDFVDYRGRSATGAAKLLNVAGKVAWIVVGQMDRSESNSLVGGFGVRQSIFTIILGAVTILILCWMGQRVLRPMRVLIDAEERLAQEDRAAALVPDDKIPNDDVGVLLRRRNTTLQRIWEAEQRYRELVEEIDGIVWEAQIGTWRYTYVSRRAESLLGYPVKQWLTEPGFWLKHLHALDRGRTVQAYLEASVAGKDLCVEYRMLTADGRVVWLRDQAHVAEDVVTVEGRRIRQLRGLMIDITAAKQAEDQIRQSERRAQTIIEMSRDAIVGIDSEAKISTFNRAAERMFHLSSHDVLGQSPTMLAPADLRERHEQAMQQFLHTGRRVGAAGATSERRALRSDGSEFPVEITLVPTNDPSIRVLATIQDISERKRAEAKLASSYERLKTNYQLANVINGVSTIEEIYDQAMDCLDATLSADRAAILLFDPDGVMRFKAWKGLSSEYRKAVEGHSPWAPDERTPSPILVPSVDADPSLQALRPVIVGEGIGALAFVPLVYQRRLLGKFMVYYNAPHQFTQDEVELAQAVASHVAFAIEHQRTEEVLRAIIAGTTAETGHDFFRALVRHLAGALRVRWAFVGESVGVAKDRIRTLALWAGEDFVDNFEYDLAGTPCEGVMGRSMCWYPKEVARRFPQDPLLAEMGVECYLGVRLSDAAGRSLGILVVMHDGSMSDPHRARAVLSAFAVRAAAELERTQDEELLRQSEQRYRTVLEYSPDPILLCDAGSKCIAETNPAFRKLFGYTAEECRALTLYDIVAADPAQLDEIIELSLGRHGGGAQTYECLRKDSSVVDIDASTNLIRSGQQDALCVVLRPRVGRYPRGTSRRDAADHAAGRTAVPSSAQDG